MKNTLVDLQNLIFHKIELLSDDNLKDDEAKLEIAKAMALDGLAKTAIQNAVVMTKFAESHGFVDDVPVMPKKALT